MKINKVLVHYPNGKDCIYSNVYDSYDMFELDHIWLGRIFNKRYKTAEVSEDKKEIWVEYVEEEK